jgi:hypothetical protein
MKTEKPNFNKVTKQLLRNQIYFHPPIQIPHSRNLVNGPGTVVFIGLVFFIQNIAIKSKKYSELQSLARPIGCYKNNAIATCDPVWNAVVDF